MSSQALNGDGRLVKVGPVRNGVAELMLDRPKKLNSLSHPMIQELKAAYSHYEQVGARCIILRGSGRALCAGGDVAEIRESIIENGRAHADFFFDEYTVDYQIATLYERANIVQVSLWDGIVMGGGVGLSVHSPVRIATEKTLFAMPETSIGLFPDVGGTWALSRLKAGVHVGRFLGVMGQKLGAADCLHAGLATHYCPSDRLVDVQAQLEALGDSANNLDAVSDAIVSVCGDHTPDTAKAMLATNAEAIQRCFGGSPSAEEIAQRLEADGGTWASKTLGTLRKLSPTSVKVTLEAIQRHQAVDLKTAFEMEYRIAQWCMRPQPHSDFCEGIRALLVDKDNKPFWDPARIEDVTNEKVEEFFAPLAAGHPRGELKL